MILRKTHERDMAHIRGLWDEAMTARDIATRRHNAQIDNIIDALGMRAAYPFESLAGKSHIEGPRGQRVEVADYPYGRDAFLVDVKLAADSAKGKKAAARLAAAMKVPK